MSKGQHAELGSEFWLRSLSQLVEIESHFEGSEIWVVSSHILDDIPGGIMFDVVANNTKRGIRYTYFLADSVEVQSRANSMQLALGNADGMSVVYIDPKVFLLLPEYDLVIYDPLRKFSEFHTAFLEIPIDSPKRLHIRLKDAVVGALVNRLVPQREL